jgi:OOP family OmpA-OmpF porin
MINKKRLLAGVALGCLLSTPAAFAEEYRGFYFSAWGGAGSADTASREDFDAVFDNGLVQSVLLGIEQDYNESSTSTGLVRMDNLGRGPSKLDDTTDVWGALLGYRLNKWFAAEVGYVNLGEVKYDFTGVIDYMFVPDDVAQSPQRYNLPYDVGYRFSSAGPTVAAVGLLPLGRYFELHAKGGIYLADSRQTVRGRDMGSRDIMEDQNFFHSRVDASQTEFFAGIGATWNATENLAVRLEYQRFFDVGDDEKNYEQDIDVINIGVLFK